MKAIDMSQAAGAIARKLCPSARPSYLAALDAGNDLFITHGITTPDRLAHFLAQAFHETNGLMIEWESGNYRTAERLFTIFGVGHHSARMTMGEAIKFIALPMPEKEKMIFERVYGLGNLHKAAELGNTEAGDGWKYRGGGILQTTGRGNYRRMGEKCGVDFEGSPELIVSAEHALKPALAEWSEANLNEAADRNDIRTITRKINGGFNGLEDRINWLWKIRHMQEETA